MLSQFRFQGLRFENSRTALGDEVYVESVVITQIKTTECLLCCTRWFQILSPWIKS